MEKTFVSVYFVPNKKEERFRFPILEEIFPSINNIKIKSREFFSEFGDQLKYIPLDASKCSICGVVGQKITLEDGREFIRKVNIRYDDTGHDKTKTHLNLDLLTIYPSFPKSKNKQKHRFKKTHLLNIKEKDIQTLHVLLQIPGSSVRRSVIVLPTLQDRKYNQKQNKFLEKLKSKRLTKKDEINFRKEFDTYSNYISGVFD